MAKTYFAILGVTSQASPDEIKSAYRRLAKAYHPDLFSGDTASFRQIQEAYDVLGNPDKRKAYQKTLEKPEPGPRPAPPPRSAPEPLIPRRGPTDLTAGEPGQPIRRRRRFAFRDMPEDLRDGRQRDSRRDSRRADVDVRLTRRQAARGGCVALTVPVRAACPDCAGRGGIGFFECGRCAGQGAFWQHLSIPVSFPGGLVDDYHVSVPLAPYGIPGTRITVRFRPPSF